MNAVVNPSVEAVAPLLPMYLAEKYFWKHSAGGRWYLSPRPEYLEYIAGTKARQEKQADNTVKVIPATNGAAARAAEYGLGLIYPNGEPGKTEEAQRVDEMAEEASAYLLSLRAFGENEAKAFERFLLDRVTRNATYAASTQFELENWAARASARGESASQHENYGEKESRLQNFALATGITYAVAKRVLPETHIGADTFNKSAARIVYESANFESDKLQTPAQAQAQTQAGADAAKITARRF